MSTLTELRDRVAALKRPDREVDAAIDCAFRFPSLRPWQPGDHAEVGGGNPGDIWCPSGFLMANVYTRSVDDVLSLIELTLPGCWWQMNKARDGKSYTAGLRRDRAAPDKIDPFDVWTDGAPCHTPALALLLALLEAKSSGETS